MFVSLRFAALLEVVPALLWAFPLFLFDDGFESTDTSAWSLTVP